MISLRTTPDSFNVKVVMHKVHYPYEINGIFDIINSTNSVQLSLQN